MNPTQNFLVIEDSAADFAMLVHALRRGGLQAECHRVETLGEFERMLEQRDWDLVISDYSLPGMRMEDALELVAARHPELPLVLVSGLVGEERAADLLKRGVWDIVLKNNLVRLAPVLNRCVSEARERRVLLEAQRERAQSEERYRLAMENMRDGFIIIEGPAGLVLSWNKAAEQIFGYRADEVIGRRLHDFVCPEQLRPQAYGMLPEFARSGSGGLIGKTIELTARRKDGSDFPAELSVSPIRVQGAWQAVGVIRDITERKRIERELIAARDAATASARTKSEFIATMSHEIRTPLNGILGMLELIGDTQLSEEQREYLQFARSSADGMIAVINDILDFFKVESHKLVLESIPFDLHKSLGDLVGPLERRARQKGLALTLEIDPAVPARLVGDPLRLRQVLLNLANNAIKFTEHGQVGIAVSVQQEEAGRVVLLFAAKDTGIGIAADQQEAIFEPYAQSDASITRKYGGTGLGLAICERLVNLMGGEIWVESQPGEGSTFYFNARFGCAPETLPAEPEPAPALAPGAPARPLDILLVEDNPVNQHFALTVLRKAGHRPVLAADGHQALEQVRARRFDLILMDIQMPGMDGFEATRMMRANGIETPIVAMSAYATADFDRLRDEAGMDDYLPKPVQAVKLLHKIEEIASGKAHTAASAPLASRPAPGGDALNLEHALSMVGGDAGLLKTLAGMVRQQIVADLPLLRRHAAQQDAPALEAVAHQLKGSLGSMGATAAHAACAALQELAKGGRQEQYGEGVRELERQLDRLYPHLDELTGKG